MDEESTAVFCRPLRCELNVLSRPDGSAIFALGKLIKEQKQYH